MAARDHGVPKTPIIDEQVRLVGWGIQTPHPPPLRYPYLTGWVNHPDQQSDAIKAPLILRHDDPRPLRTPGFYVFYRDSSMNSFCLHSEV